MSDVQREAIDYDIVIVGGGPAGLATAIRLKQQAAEAGTEITVCVLEKAAEIGAHTVSGAVLDSRALDELLPNWRDEGRFEFTEVQQDEFFFLRSASSALRIPNVLVPAGMHNTGQKIISLGSLCRWLAECAAEWDVDLFPGFAAASLIFDARGAVAGAITSDRGIGRNGERKPGFEPGIELRAKQTVLAEGARGHLARQLTERFALTSNCDPQHYALGFKEIWEVAPEKHMPGRVIHGSGWPLSGGKPANGSSDSGSGNATGGFFSYHAANGHVSIGLIVDLNYPDPYLSPYEEFQRLKQHALFSDTLKSGKRIAYGARAITKGGLNALGRLTVPGAIIVGCSAGTLNFAKVKGIHTAMKSGMVAADVIIDALQNEPPEAARLAARDLEHYRARLLASWVGDELRAARNVQPALHRFGPYIGGAYVFVDQLLRGRVPWTLHDRVDDHDALVPAGNGEHRRYSPPDGVVSFDRLSSVYLSGTNHTEDQPSHLTFTDSQVPIAVNLRRYAAPEQRYCPAGVYEIVEQDGAPQLQVNAQNCIHCKACDIKDPQQNIVWVPPEDGGPVYTNM